MEYCSHLWGGSANYQLEALDSVDRRARRIKGDKSLTQAKLHSLQYRRNFFTGYTSVSVLRNFTILFLLRRSTQEQRDTMRGGILMCLIFHQHA
ncbi:jg27356 [Pararge aegeria aegeria]|uniref:Jg27356 protein n=1 Tax=Pararge aegeria aegeria TaxID=348720 RepID=A0A8S4R9L0_9NEOP|nr:jg27356 [Pararge aegeria aegeria]